EANRKNYPRAIEYYEKSIDVVPKSSIPIVLAIKKTFYARFLCYYDAIKYEDKIDSLYTASHQLFLKNGYDDTRKNDYATLVNFIGIFHLDLGRLDSAKHYFDNALAINLELFGENNSATLDNLNNLAVIKLKREKYVEARKGFKDIWRRANEAGIVPSTAIVYYHNYASTFNKLGDYASAEIKFDSLTSYREKYLQNDLVRLNNARKELAEASIGNEKYEKAEEVLRSIIKDHQKSMPDDGEQDIRAYIELARIRKLVGDESAALTIKAENRNRILKRLSAESEVYTLNEGI
ncbi:MAG: tetratricopeptide repeat protein, partial [Bacteroidota bacterium]